MSDAPGGDTSTEGAPQPWSLWAPDDDPRDTDLLEQFYATLRVAWRTSLADTVPEIGDELERLFELPHSWGTAYEIEQYLCFVMTPEQLTIELERRFNEAEALKLSHVGVLGALKEKADAQDDNARRAVLQRILNDLQWFYAKRMQRRAASKKLMVRVSSLFLSALLIFLLVLFNQFVANPPEASGGAQERPAGADPPAPGAPTGGLQ